MNPEARSTAASRALGRRLRELRVERGLSLADVAKASAISVSFLSLVETGKSDISFGRLMRLVAFYGVDLDELVDMPSASPVVVRAGQEGHVVSRGEGIDLGLLAHQPHGPLMTLVAVYERGGATADPIEGDGRPVFLYVVDGALELVVEGEEPIVLRTGDSAYVASEHRRSYRNTHLGPTRVLVVAAGPPVAMLG
jgi:transcriptional regulator with XRE-family HTH domain